MKKLVMMKHSVSFPMDDVSKTFDPRSVQLSPRGYTEFAHPALCVPCPECQQGAGDFCLRPSGRRAANLHIARRELVDLLFMVDYGDRARLSRTVAGWAVEPLTPWSR